MIMMWMKMDDNIYWRYYFSIGIRLSCLFFGRHPIPDYYSLTLEIQKNRTTAAWTEVCRAAERRQGHGQVRGHSEGQIEGHGQGQGRCGYTSAGNDQFLHRTLNDECLHLVRIA